MTPAAQEAAVGVGCLHFEPLTAEQVVGGFFLGCLCGFVEAGGLWLTGAGFGWFALMPEWLSKLRKLALKYLKGCGCSGGGYCFYKLDEPNASDTYYAVATIDLLDGCLEDPRTLQYLLELQDAEGSFASPFTACYVIKALALMRKRPRRNPAGYLLSQIDSFAFDPDNQPAETISIFNRLFCLVDAASVLGLEINRPLRENICSFVLTFRRKDRGFGHIRSTLLETVQALRILAQLGFPVVSLTPGDFIGACETPTCGFTGVPGCPVLASLHTEPAFFLL